MELELIKASDCFGGTPVVGQWKIFDFRSLLPERQKRQQYLRVCADHLQGVIDDRSAELNRKIHKRVTNEGKEYFFSVHVLMLPL